MKAIFTFIVFVLFALTSDAQHQAIRVYGKIENSKNNWLEFRKDGVNVLTGKRDLTRYKATVNQKGEFEILLPSTEISAWLIEIDNVFKRVDFGIKGSFKMTIAVNNNYSTSVFDEFGNDFNFKSSVETIVSTKFSYEKLEQLKPLEAFAFRKEKAVFQLSLLADYQKNHQMDKDYVEWLGINYKYEPYGRSLSEDKVKPDSATILLLTEKGIENDFAAMNSQDYNTLIEYYIHYKFNDLRFPVKIAKIFDFGAKSLTGLTKQVYLTQRIFNLSKSPDSIYNPIYAKYKNEVTNETLLSLVKNERDAHLLALKESSLSKENISTHSSLNEIFKKYKGKVIYVDFWASWCGPCMSEMPNAARLKEKLKGKDVVFVYFGYKNEKAHWLAARKELNIAGEHYLLSDKLIAEADSVFKIAGIPHYAIIDKDGNIIEKKALRPAKVYQQLLKLAENK